MKLLRICIIAGLARTIVGVGNYYITATNWMIGKDQTVLSVVNEAIGTCITTGTYGTICAIPIPVDITMLPLTPSTTAMTTPTTTSTDNPACVIACATQTCPGFWTSTNCFCDRMGDIGYCMVGDCGIQYQTATVLAGKLCGTHSHFIHIHTNQLR